LNVGLNAKAKITVVSVGWVCIHNGVIEIGHGLVISWLDNAQIGDNVGIQHDTDSEMLQAARQDKNSCVALFTNTY